MYAGALFTLMNQQELALHFDTVGVKWYHGWPYFDPILAHWHRDKSNPVLTLLQYQINDPVLALLQCSGPYLSTITALEMTLFWPYFYTIKCRLSPVLTLLQYQMSDPVLALLQCSWPYLSTITALEMTLCWPYFYIIKCPVRHS